MGQDRAEVRPVFLIAIPALITMIGALLWYTNWAEERILNAEPEARSAEAR